MKAMIPTRAEIPVKLSDTEKDCIAWYVLSGCSMTEAFATFCRPELRGSRLVLEKVTSQFFASADAISYVEAYRKLVEKTLTASKINDEKILSSEDLNKRKERAMQKLMNYVIDQSNMIETIEDKESIIKFADKLGLLDHEENAVEPPRRYLPESCSQCRYKAFIEENCEEN